MGGAHDVVMQLGLDDDGLLDGDDDDVDMRADTGPAQPARRARDQRRDRVRPSNTDEGAERRRAKRAKASAERLAAKRASGMDSDARR